MSADLPEEGRRPLAWAIARNTFVLLAAAMLISRSSPLAATGRHGDARRAYRRYAERLAEIGVEPASFPAPVPRVSSSA